MKSTKAVQTESTSAGTWGQGTGEMFKSTNLQLVDKVSPRDQMHSTVIIGNNTVS